MSTSNYKAASTCLSVFSVSLVVLIAVCLSDLATRAEGKEYNVKSDVDNATSNGGAQTRRKRDIQEIIENHEGMFPCSAGIRIRF